MVHSSCEWEQTGWGSLGEMGWVGKSERRELQLRVLSRRECQHSGKLLPEGTSET